MFPQEWQKLILEVKECPNRIFLEILIKNIFEMEIKKKNRTYFWKIWKKKEVESTKNLKFYYQILTFENVEIFEILRFWKNILRFRIWKKNWFWDFDKKSDFQILRFFKISDFIRFSKLWFVINTHSILTNDICMNIYIIRRIVSTCQNIQTVIIKEVRAD